jgi:two-component system cell cycle sensor histidine kinase/response regulator CckA
MSNAAGGSPGTILNVEDDLLCRFGVTYLLRSAGFQVLEAGTVAEALPLVADKPDLVLLDVHLPDGSGFDVCRRIKEDPATAAIPVVFLSAVAVQGEDRIRGLALGADDYLVKPVEPAVVVAHVKALLRIRQAERQAHAAQVQAAEARSRLADAEKTLARDALLLAGVRDPLLITDLQGVVNYWNEGGTRLFGWQASEMLGRPLAERFPEHEQAAFRAILQSITPGEDWEGEFEDYRKDGSRVWVEIHASRSAGAAGEQDGILWRAHDITRRKRLEELYQQAQKMEALGRLAGGVAHDFNNLLTIINGYGELLLASLPRENPVYGMIDQMTKAGERAAALTRQLLTFSRRQLVSPRVLDLNAVVADLEKMLRRIIGEDVDLCTLLQPCLGHVRADPAQIDQVILNLAVNARDAMPTGGQLVLETRDVELDEAYTRAHPDARPGPHVMLAVRDSGCGMTDAVKARLFEPFFTTKEPGKGTGLGLATVYGIVKQSGGHVAVSSVPELGTTFQVYLPSVREAVTRSKAQQSGGELPWGSETVLVVEDEPGVRSLTCRVLRESGYRVLEASQPAEARRLAGRHRGPIHLLLTDVVMRGGGGCRLAETLLARYPEMKVLYLSGYTDDAVLRHGILEAEVSFLPKPFSPAVLSHKVREVLDAPAAVPET